MFMFNYCSLLIAAATPLATFLGIIWAIYQYTKEATRKKRSETLDVYACLFNEIYTLRDVYYKNTNELLFSSEKIHADTMLYKEIMVLLTHIESFARGLECDIYDFEIYIYLTPEEMFEILNSLKQFVYDERKIKAYSRLFNDFTHLIDVTSLCVQKKISNKRFKKKYRKIRV